LTITQRDLIAVGEGFDSPEATKRQSL